jgi:rifampin ADP-ribosylating transferase
MRRMEQRHGSVRLPDGTTLPYVEQGAPSGVPVVLLHAVGESWRSWSRLLPQLPPDLWAVAVTQRGHGDADKPEAGYAVADLAADAVGLLDALGVHRAVLCGTSSGGLVAQRVAVDRPDRVRALCLVGSPRGLRDTPVPGWVDDAAALSDPVPESFARASVEGFPVGRALPEDFVRQMVEDATRVPARVWREAVRGLVEAEPPTDSGRISAPTLVICGGGDDLLTLEHEEALAAAIPGATLVAYAGTGHLVLWEEPERVASDLVALLRRSGEPDGGSVRHLP